MAFLFSSDPHTCFCRATLRAFRVVGSPFWPEAWSGRSSPCHLRRQLLHRCAHLHIVEEMGFLLEAGGSAYVLGWECIDLAVSLTGAVNIKDIWIVVCVLLCHWVRSSVTWSLGHWGVFQAVHASLPVPNSSVCSHLSSLIKENKAQVCPSFK